MTEKELKAVIPDRDILVELLREFRTKDGVDLPALKKKVLVFLAPFTCVFSAVSYVTCGVIFYFTPVGVVFAHSQVLGEHRLVADTANGMAERLLETGRRPSQTTRLRQRRETLTRARAYTQRSLRKTKEGGGRSSLLSARSFQSVGSYQSCGTVYEMKEE